MIKARSGDVVILGLSRENINRLMDDQPIRFDGDVLGFPGETFYIVFGETEQAIAADLVKLKHAPPDGTEP